MEIEKSDVEWLITLLAMIFIAFRNPSQKTQKDTHQRKKRKRKAKK